MEWPTFSIAPRKLPAGKRLPGKSGSAGRCCSPLPWAFVCVGLALPAHLTVVAIVPVLIAIVAVLAAFRVMG